MSEATREDFKEAVQTALFAADIAAINFDGTYAEQTRAVVTRAVGALLQHGMIQLTDSTTWPFSFSPTELHEFEKDSK